MPPVKFFYISGRFIETDTDIVPDVQSARSMIALKCGVPMGRVQLMDIGRILTDDTAPIASDLQIVYLL